MEGMDLSDILVTTLTYTVKIFIQKETSQKHELILCMCDTRGALPVSSLQTELGHN